MIRYTGLDASAAASTLLSLTPRSAAAARRAFFHSHPTTFTMAPSTVRSSVLGFPRMGGDRELKKLVEAYWAKKVSQEELLAQSKAIRANHLKLQQSFGIDRITTNDASLYDHILDWSYTIGAIPERYKGLNSLQLYFAMGRGLQVPAEGIDVTACEMRKWYDTNYHYIVPELHVGTEFKVNSTVTAKPVSDYKEAKELGIDSTPVIVGPITYILLAKTYDSNKQLQHSLTEPIFKQLLAALIPVYQHVIKLLTEAGAKSIRLDESSLVTDLPDFVTSAYADTYKQLFSSAKDLHVTVATYFGEVRDHIKLLVDLPIHCVHVDLTKDTKVLQQVLPLLKSRQPLELSLGLVDGRNIWINDLKSSVETIKRVVSELGAARVIVSTSSSLLHTPHSLEREVKLNKEIKQWFAFASEKLRELQVLTKAVNNDSSSDVPEYLQQNATAITARKESKLIHNPTIQQAMQQITSGMLQRKNNYSVRKGIQDDTLQLPLFPTTTIGSFPQTTEIRATRAQFKAGKITAEEYKKNLQEKTIECIRLQEELDIDVLVHGEFERNDMVESFGELLDGYVFTQFGWVQSYGSRCVKPPIIYGDISRPNPMTVEWSQFAAKQTKRVMKAMLTGPITMLRWSFVRNDQTERDTAFQLALALRHEVQDLEKAGLKVIQVDEPAIREGLPLRRSDWDTYLKWSVESFRLATSGVEDSTQIHTHMCYSDFGDIISSIQALDADVTTIENAKSDEKLLSAFVDYVYENSLGPGLYDIHSPRVPSVEELYARAKALLKYISVDKLWLNPDCGLKTRNWPETKEALKNLTTVAKQLRQEFYQKK